ncbi:MAG TPA: copper chaperone PCu(A)C [Burkholderiales bacterium]
MKYVLLLAALIAAPALAQVTVENAWARATPPGARIGAGYFTLRNTGTTADRLVAVSSPAAARVETHVTVKEGDVSKMREVKGYEVPAKGSLELKPGGSHLMFVDIKAPFKEGQRIEALLRFAKAGEVKVQFEVRPLGSASHEHQHMH